MLFLGIINGVFSNMIIRSLITFHFMIYMHDSMGATRAVEITLLHQFGQYHQRGQG